MPAKKNIKIREFIADVAQQAKANPTADKLEIGRFRALHAAKFISNIITCGAIGGKIGGKMSKGGGRKITKNTADAVKKREAMRRYRANLKKGKSV